MTVAKPISNLLPTLGDFTASVLARFKSDEQGTPPVPTAQQVASQIEPDSIDQARYARLLENELDRQHLSAVEREDMDMLDRVRDALYADD